MLLLLIATGLVVLPRFFSDRARFHICFEAKIHYKFILILLIYTQENSFLHNLFYSISFLLSHMLKILDSINITIITSLFYPTSLTQQSQKNTTVVDCYH